MNPLLLFGGGALVTYLLLRVKDAAAATTPAAPASTTTEPTPSPPTAPQVPAPVAIGAPTPKPIPQGTSSPKQPQITIPGPPWSSEIARSTVLSRRWGWPVPRWQGRAPVVSDGFGSRRPPPYDTHQGVDLMFARISSDPFPIGPNATTRYVMPDAWMAVAASDGVLWSAGKSPRGYSVVIDHGDVATFYQHLELLLVPETTAPVKGAPKEHLVKIKAGQPLGVIGGDPLDPSHVKHLHFELWPAGPASAIDPQAIMKTWQVFSPDDVAPHLQAMRRNAAKRRDLVQVRAHERRFPGSSLNPP